MEINNLELSDAKEYNSEVEKERMEKFLRSGIIRKYHYTLSEIKRRLWRGKSTISKLKEEVENKTSTMTKSQRDFIMTYDEDFILQLLKEL